MSLAKFSNGAYPSRFNYYYNNDVFNDLLSRNNRQAANSKPAVNIKENEDDFTLELATPGLQKEDFKLEVNNDILTISAEVKADENKEKYSKREFSPQSFKRSFTLQETLESEHITAQYKNGILLVTIPKKEEAKPKAKVEIAVS